MTAKEYLRQIQLLDTIAKQQQNEIALLRDKTMSLRSVDYSVQKVRSSPQTGAGFEHAIDKLATMCAEYAQQCEQAARQRKEIIEQIQSLDNAVYVQILYKRYAEYKSFSMISMEIGYSDEHTRREHGRALQSFYEKYSRVFDTKCY